MDEILVSINCITYNHEKYVAEAIDSFLMQKTNFKFEILIHDDASTDRTTCIIMEYQKKYPDLIKPILQKENQQSQGISKIFYTFNHVRAKGKYIAMCEGDDYWTDPYKLQKQVDYMENHPDCSMCFHAADKVKVGIGKISTIMPYDQNCISPTADIVLGGGGFMATSSILYRKTSMDNAPDFFFNAPVGDYPLQILTSTKNYAYYINEVMSAYRVGVEGSWTSDMASKINWEEKFIEHFKRTIEMLKRFNQYSQGKYSDIVNKKILRKEFEILKIEKKIKQLKGPKYKAIYNDIGLKEKTIIYAMCYFPKMCHRIASFEKCMKQYMEIVRQSLSN